MVKRPIEVNDELWRLVKAFAILKKMKIDEAVEFLLDKSLKDFKEITKNV